MTAAIAVLFARSDSIYKDLPDLDVYDLERDARNFDFSAPVIAHPPCRAWGRLRTFSKPRPDEKDLGLFAVRAVRACGGVLEHPESSTLWQAAGLPRPGAVRDVFGGWTFPVVQHWWGHRARKATWLYIVGVCPQDLPEIPLQLGDAPCTIGKWSGRDRSRQRPEIGPREREATPHEFARWLVELARSSRGHAGMPC